MKNILFYKYIDISNLDSLQNELQVFCERLNILGKILLSKEGINGCMTGEDEVLEIFKKDICERFGETEFKEGKVEDHTFRKLVIRQRNEIVTSGMDVSLENTGKHLQPREVKELYDSGEDFIVLDARNRYEYNVGKFKNAIHLDIKTFRTLPKKLDEIEQYKDKKILMYCTGGVRCEKASALLVESGFKDVNQIHGGILNYGKEVGDTHWQGQCYVFDDREVINISENDTPIMSHCEICEEKHNKHKNCKECDRMFIVCTECDIKHNRLCSNCLP